MLDDGLVEAVGGGHHPDVCLGEGGDGDALLLELLGCLAEAPGVVHDFAELVAGGELADQVMQSRTPRSPW